MTFKEWFHDYEWSPEKEAWGQSVWNAAQQAERKEKAELIAAAEAVLGCYVYEHDEMDAFEEFERLRIALEKMKNDDR